MNAPSIAAATDDRLDGHAAWRAIETALPFVPAAAAIAALAAARQDLVDAALATGIAYQAAVVVWHGGKRRFRVQAVGGTILTGVLAVALSGPGASALLMPAGIACVLVGLGRVQTAAVRGRVARALRQRRLLSEEPDAARGRDFAALALVLPTIVTAFLLVPLATWIVECERDWLRRASAALPPPEKSGWTDPPAGGDSGLTRPGARGKKIRGAATGGVRPDVGTLEFGTPDPFLDRRIVLEATPTQGGRTTGDLGPVYLRATPLVDVEGEWIEDVEYARRVDDAADGRADGWCELSMRPVPQDELDLAVHLATPQLATTGELVLISPPGTASVEAASVRAAPGGALLLRLASRVDSFDYRLVARLPTRVAFPGPNTRFASGDPRASAPPAADGPWADLVAMARPATAGAATDVGRVRAVVAFLRERFQHERWDERPREADPLASFVLRGRGTPLEFAQAGVVMLRSAGVPARVGRGFVVGAWDDERACYVGRVCDSRAWIEVAFQGCGWVIFDPTPGAPDDWAWTRPEPAAATGTRDAAAEGPFRDDWRPGFDAIVGETSGAIDRAWDWIARHSWLCAVAASIAIFLAARALDRRGRRLAGEPVGAPARRGPWERLLAELARRGHRRRASQTAIEFAACVAASGGGAYAPLVALTARQQAARFGARPLTPGDEREIDALRGSLRSAAPPQRPGPGTCRRE